MNNFFRYAYSFILLNLLVSLNCFSIGIEQFIPQETEGKTDDEYLKKVLKGTSQFALDLYRASQNQSENFFVSPYALATGLSMIGEGAKEETREEIQQALSFSLNLAPLLKTIDHYLYDSNQSSRNFQLSLVNGIWVQNEKTLVPAYKFSLKRVFDYTLDPLDFNTPSEAFSKINRWVSAQSKGKINSIISYQDVTRKTQLLLTTGFYFKGEWLNPFDQTQTQKAPFTARGYPFNVEMMKRVGSYSILIQPQFVIIEIPYKPLRKGGAQFSLTLFLPNEDVDIQQVENQLNINQWYQWMQEIKPQQVELFLPKFRVEERSNLTELLQRVGIRKAFTSQADFSGIDEKKISLSKVVQRAIIHVDESGSDGWVSRIPPSLPLKEEKTPYPVKVNRPFIFLLQEVTTHLIISIGKVELP